MKRNASFNNAHERQPNGAGAGHPDYLLTAYLFENLSAAGRSEVEAHLSRCPACRTELEALRAVLGLAEEALDPGTRAYTFDESRKRRMLAAATFARNSISATPIRGSFLKWSWKIGAVAAVLLVVVLGVAINGSTRYVDSSRGTQRRIAVDSWATSGSMTAGNEKSANGPTSTAVLGAVTLSGAVNSEARNGAVTLGRSTRIDTTPMENQAALMSERGTHPTDPTSKQMSTIEAPLKYRIGDGTLDAAGEIDLAKQGYVQKQNADQPQGIDPNAVLGDKGDLKRKDGVTEQEYAGLQKEMGEMRLQMAGPAAATPQAPEVATHNSHLQHALKAPPVIANPNYYIPPAPEAPPAPPAEAAATASAPLIQYPNNWDMIPQRDRMGLASPEKPQGSPGVLLQPRLDPNFSVGGKTGAVAPQTNANGAVALGQGYADDYSDKDALFGHSQNAPDVAPTDIFSLKKAVASREHLSGATGEPQVPPAQNELLSAGGGAGIQKLPERADRLAIPPSNQSDAHSVFGTNDAPLFNKRGDNDGDAGGGGSAGVAIDGLIGTQPAGSSGPSKGWGGGKRPDDGAGKGSFSNRNRSMQRQGGVREDGPRAPESTGSTPKNQEFAERLNSDVNGQAAAEKDGAKKDTAIAAKDDTLGRVTNAPEKTNNALSNSGATVELQGLDSNVLFGDSGDLRRSGAPTGFLQPRVPGSADATPPNEAHAGERWFGGKPASNTPGNLPHSAQKVTHSDGAILNNAASNIISTVEAPPTYPGFTTASAGTLTLSGSTTFPNSTFANTYTGGSNTNPPTADPNLHMPSAFFTYGADRSLPAIVAGRDKSHRGDSQNQALGYTPAPQEQRIALNNELSNLESSVKGLNNSGQKTVVETPKNDPTAGQKLPFPGIVSSPTAADSNGSFSTNGSIANHAIQLLPNDPNTVSAQDTTNTVRQSGVAAPAETPPSQPPLHRQPVYLLNLDKPDTVNKSQTVDSDYVMDDNGRRDPFTFTRPVVTAPSEEPGEEQARKSIEMLTRKGVDVEKIVGKDSTQKPSEQLESILRKGIDVYHVLGDLPDVPAISAKVLAVRPDTGLVMLSVGSQNGAKIGYQFKLSHGADYKATAQVVNVFPDMCSAKIIPGTENPAGLKIEANDEAQTDGTAPARNESTGNKKGFDIASNAAAKSKQLIRKFEVTPIDADAATELSLRGFRALRAENPKLTYDQFLHRPDVAHPVPLTDEGLDEDDYIAKHGTRPFVDCARDHLSTFGMDVDTAAYTLARSTLRSDKLPAPDSIRTEEFVNYFKQPYTVQGDEAFGVFAESAQSPFVDTHVQAHDSALLNTENLHTRELLKIGIKSRAARPGERKPAVLTFVVDTSGSMSKNATGLTRLDLVKQALTKLVDALNSDDAVGIVGFGDQAELILPRTQARHKQRILDAIDSMTAGGSTNVEAGLNLGYRMADEAYATNAVNRMILFSDGVANVGEKGPNDILKLVALFAQRGVDLSTVGVGTNHVFDPMLRTLADTGNGSCHVADTLDEANKILLEKLPPHLNVLARDAKVQVDFNVDTVKSYRLLGYEKRKIADKDFRNDKIDSGDVGHDTLVTVFYEIVRQPAVHGSLGRVYLRWKDAGSPRLEVIERNYPLEESTYAGAACNASPDFRFLACVARFAELLRDSKWVRQGSYAEVLSELQRLPAAFKAKPDCAEVIDLVERAQRLSIAQWKSELK